MSRPAVHILSNEQRWLHKRSNCQFAAFLQTFPRMDYTFQQDNGAIHVSRQTKAWLDAHHISMLEWPACSPHLNPIENLWGIVVRHVYADNRHFDSCNDLKATIKATWATIDRQTLTNLIQSVPNWIFEVIQRSGALFWLLK